MSTKTIKTRIKLRRDTEANFAPIENTFIPLNGEVVLIDTASGGLKSKVGDGVKTLAALEFTDANLVLQIHGIVVRGYYYNDKFYQDAAHTQEIAGFEYKVYIDKPSLKIYGYDSTLNIFAELSSVPTASSSTAGIMLLYTDLGQNTNGTITQKAISDEINKKFEVTLEDGDTLVFT